MSQIADNRFPCVMQLGGLSVNLNHLKWLYMEPYLLLQKKFVFVKYIIFALLAIYQVISCLGFFLNF